MTSHTAEMSCDTITLSLQLYIRGNFAMSQKPNNMILETISSLLTLARSVSYSLCVAILVSI